ncbi:MAG: hypothetical protein WCG75_08325 [Armatimonadota bacterium]
MAGKSNASNLSFVSNECPDILHYWLLGDTGSVTLKGIFINRYGKQTGAAISTTVPVGDTVNNPVQISTSIPADAVGFIGNTSGGLRFGLFVAGEMTVAGGSTTITSDFKANFGSYPFVAAGNALNFGSVAVV